MVSVGQMTIVIGGMLLMTMSPLPYAKDVAVLDMKQAPGIILNVNVQSVGLR